MPQLVTQSDEERSITVATNSIPLIAVRVEQEVGDLIENELMIAFATAINFLRSGFPMVQFLFKIARSDRPDPGYKDNVVATRCALERLAESVTLPDESITFALSNVSAEVYYMKRTRRQ